MQYQPREDVQTEARIDLDVEEILDLLQTDDDDADFDAAMAIYSDGGGNGAAATLKSLATPGSSTMADDTWWPIYRAYWNSDNYADDFVTNTATLPEAMRKELIKKGSVYQGVWMHAVHNFDKGKRECDVVLWDKGMAYYVGSLEGEYETSADIASDGNLIYSLAQKRCENFGTCERSTDKTTFAAVNSEIQSADGFAVQGKNLLYNRVGCGDAGLDVAFKGIVSQMTVPLVQGLLRYAWKADPEMEDSCDGQENTDADAVAANDAIANTDCAKSWAEGWAFAAAVLPQIDRCDSAAAATVRANLDVAASEPMKDGVAAVKAAVESVYCCLGITCEDVGTLMHSYGTPYLGMHACTTVCPGGGGGGGGGDGGLGTGALVGVIIVVLVAGVGVLGLVFWLYRADKLRCCVRGDVEASTGELEVGTIRNPAVAEKDML